MASDTACQRQRAVFPPLAIGLFANRRLMWNIGLAGWQKKVNGES